jgi:hypothetical protein
VIYLQDSVVGRKRLSSFRRDQKGGEYGVLVPSGVWFVEAETRRPSEELFASVGAFAVVVESVVHGVVKVV